MGLDKFIKINDTEKNIFREKFIQYIEDSIKGIILYVIEFARFNFQAFYNPKRVIAKYIASKDNLFSLFPFTFFFTSFSIYSLFFDRKLIPALENIELLIQYLFDGITYDYGEIKKISHVMALSIPEYFFVIVLAAILFKCFKNKEKIEIINLLLFGYAYCFSSFTFSFLVVATIVLILNNLQSPILTAALNPLYLLPIIFPYLTGLRFIFIGLFRNPAIQFKKNLSNLFLVVILFTLWLIILLCLPFIFEVKYIIESLQ